jgi:hypothetical protein
MDIVAFLNAYWGPLTAAGGFVIGYYLLKQRVEDLGGRVSTIETNLEEWRDEVRKEVNTALTKADDTLNRYIEMEKEEHVVIIARFEGEISRLGARVDKNFDRLSDKLDKLVEYSMNKRREP